MTAAIQVHEHCTSNGDFFTGKAYYACACAAVSAGGREGLAQTETSFLDETPASYPEGSSLLGKAQVCQAAEAVKCCSYGA